MEHSEILANLRRTILEYDKNGSREWAEKAVEAGVDPLEALEALTGSIRVVGEAFGSGELFLPELIGAAEALQAATPVMEAEFLKRGLGRRGAGTVVIGSVHGDIHNIGKSMVCSLMTADGFTVHDVGIDVSTQTFVESVEKHKPDILAMSALLTTTAPEGKKVIDALQEAGLREQVKVMIGGGAINAEFASVIGADGYDPTAPGAVKVARSLLGVA